MCFPLQILCELYNRYTRANGPPMYQTLIFVTKVMYFICSLLSRLHERSDSGPLRVNNTELIITLIEKWRLNQLKRL